MINLKAIMIIELSRLPVVVVVVVVVLAYTQLLDEVRVSHLFISGAEGLITISCLKVFLRDTRKCIPERE